MDNVIHKLHKELDTEPDDIKDVIKSVEYFVAEQIASGEFKNIRIPGLGIFYISEKQKENLTKLKKNEEL